MPTEFVRLLIALPGAIYPVGVAKSYQTNIIAVTQTAFYAADANGNKTPTCRR